ncbi:sugar-binding protein, partial [Candidatus Poribacteria bacterium]
HPADDTWWEDDSLEVMFDFTNDGSLVQWTIDANGEEISAAATEENLEWKVVNIGDQYIFEGAIDSTKDNPDKPGFGKDFQGAVGVLIGLAFHFNECENGTREHQIGWTPGGAWDAAAYGDLIFSAEQAAVDASDKLTTTWGNLKR